MGGLAFACVGLLLLCLAAWSASATRSFIRTATSAEGQVVALNAGGSHPQIRFTTPAGQVISYPQGGLIFGYRSGDVVRVLFDAGDPAGTATIDSAGALWFRALLFCGLGALFGITGVMWWLGAGSTR
jgi:Protein of unknown function (DUF3592)